MKNAVKVVFGGLGLLLLFIYVSVASQLLNANSDLAAGCGYMMFVLLAGGAVAFVLRSGRTVRDKLGKLLCVAVLAPALLSLTGCYKVVSPGNVGIVVKQTGSDRGVQDIPIQTGRVFYNPFNENVLEYPTYVQRAIWTVSTAEGHQVNEEISFQSSDSLQFTGDVAVAYQLVQEKVPHFYVQFRTDDLDTFTHGFFRDAVRKSIGLASTHYTAEQINGGKQAALEAEAQDALGNAMGPFGVTIRQLAFTSPPRPPTEVRNAIQSKIAAIQDAERVENQKRSAIAEGEKIKALAAATAESNRLINSSLTPQLVQWRSLDIMGNKWDGRLPQVQTGSGSGLLLSVPVSKGKN